MGGFNPYGFGTGAYGSQGTATAASAPATAAPGAPLSPDQLVQNITAQNNIRSPAALGSDLLAVALMKYGRPGAQALMNTPMSINQWDSSAGTGMLPGLTGMQGLPNFPFLGGG